MNIFKNIQIKLLSVLSALLLWVFVVGVENFVYLLPTEQPVKVINLGQNVSVANELSKVKVRYKATDSTGANVNSNNFDLFVDAQNLSEGTYLLEVEAISRDPKITVVSIEPSRLELDLEAITSKDIKLTSDVEGKPSKDYEVKDVKLSQDTIKISGAASVLSKITEMPIKISLDGTETADFSRKITVEAPAEWNLSGKTVSFDPPVIQADIQVRKMPRSEINNNTSNNVTTNDANPNLVKKTFMADIVKEGQLSTSVKELLPQNILVTVEGEDSEIAKLTNDSIKLDLRVSAISKGVYTVQPADIVIPAGVKVNIVEFSPAEVAVKF